MFVLISSKKTAFRILTIMKMLYPHVGYGIFLFMVAVVFA